MSGYIGNPDAESEHALILAENGINASREAITGDVRTECLDCGDTIDPKRVAFLESKGMKCHYCITCQPFHDTVRQVKMLDRIL